MWRRRWVVLAIATPLAMLSSAAACGSDESPTATAGASTETLRTPTPNPAGAPVTLPTILTPPEMHTFEPRALEIDQLGAGPGDANLVVGADVDGSPSAQMPPSTLAFVDWNEMGVDIDNHRLVDPPDGTGRDSSAFPGSNECVAAANVLAKMDLTYIGATNNMDHAYFAVQRSANNGDAGYYWVFTKKAPKLVVGEAPCGPDKARLVYDVTGGAPGEPGDILIKGHFKPSAEPLLEVFHATRNEDHVPATRILDYTGTLWRKDGGIGAAAVNTTVTSPGAFGAAGVKSMSGSNLDTELFAEAALPLSTFTGTNPCGATYYASVITRSSGAGGTSPDLKDLAGPVLFHFGNVEVEATALPTCGLGVDLALTSARGMDGEPIPSPVCTWTIDGNPVAGSSCTMTAPVATAGAHTAALTVTDPLSSCSTTTTMAPVTIYEPLGVTADLTATCTSGFGYSSSVTGGSPAGVDTAWSFSGPGTVTPATSSAASGNATVAQPNADYTGTVTITDKRTDGLTCTATDDDTARPFAPLSVHLLLDAAAQTCPTMTSDAATWNVSASGGNGSYGTTWNGVSCTGTSCTVDPASTDLCVGPTSLSVTLSDTSGICPPVTSETESYQKVTTVTASNN